MLLFCPGFELPVQPVPQLLSNNQAAEPAAKPAQPTAPDINSAPTTIAPSFPPMMGQQPPNTNPSQFTPQPQQGFNQAQVRMPNPNMPPGVRGAAPWQGGQGPRGAVPPGPRAQPTEILRAALIDPRAAGANPGPGNQAQQVRSSLEIFILDLLSLPFLSHFSLNSLLPRAEPKLGVPRASRIKPNSCEPEQQPQQLPSRLEWLFLLSSKA